MEKEKIRQELKRENMMITNTFEMAQEEITIDWRGRPSRPNKHGGMRAAVFVLGTLLSLSLSLRCSFPVFLLRGLIS